MQEFDAQLASLPPPLGDKIARHLKLTDTMPSSHRDIVGSLHFLTGTDKRLESEAYAISKRCAALLNEFRGSLRKLDHILEILFDKELNQDFALHRESIKKVQEFLRLFCVDDGVEAKPLQPPTALAKLREEPGENFAKFKTHSYSPYSLLDMICDDCSNAHTGFIALLDKKFFDEHLLPVQPGRKMPEWIVSRDWLMPEAEYKQFCEQFDHHIGALQDHALELRDSCHPDAQKAPAAQK